MWCVVVVERVLRAARHCAASSAHGSQSSATSRAHCIMSTNPAWQPENTAGATFCTVETFAGVVNASENVTPRWSHGFMGGM